MFWSKRKWPAKLPKQNELNLSFHYNSITNQVNASHIGFKAIQIVSSEPSILSNLGFHYINTHQHKKVNGDDHDRLYYVFDGTKAGAPKLQTQNQNNFMYIHSNIIQHQNIGHKKAQLLAIVPVRAWRPVRTWRPKVLEVRSSILFTAEDF